MRGSVRRLGARLRAVIEVRDEPPARLAAGLALGAFIGCTPFWGVQMLLALLLATLLRLNRAVAVAGTWLNLPWTAPLVYAAALRIGHVVVPDPAGVRGAGLASLLDDPAAFGWRRALTVLSEMSTPLLVGTTIVGSGVALVTFLVVFGVARRRRRGPRAGSGTPRRAA
jgi:uncharacterized protein (DUF2062 family)